MNQSEASNSISKPVALVTGASRGIGATIARKLASDGYQVLLNYSHQESKAHEIQSKILADGGKAELCQFDVSNSTQVDDKIQWISDTFGPVQVLVNNAGINIDGLLLRLKDEDLSKVLDVNLKGAIYCTRSAARQMIRAKVGSIIFISSIAGEIGNPGQSAYSAAKAGLVGFAKTVARELASRKIRVNVVSPGFIETEMTEALTPVQKEAILHSIPLGFFGSTEDISAVVSFLASPASRYITGQVFSINGGMSM